MPQQPIADGTTVESLIARADSARWAVQPCCCSEQVGCATSDGAGCFSRPLAFRRGISVLAVNSAGSWMLSFFQAAAVVASSASPKCANWLAQVLVSVITRTLTFSDAARIARAVR